ncbi:MAG: HAMP domain-containing protein [Candidatus Omnitrophica bacterium]|nr:HAMP domain-containing protein [Candidatus Omnitrophota bacterium]
MRQNRDLKIYLFGAFFVLLLVFGVLITGLGFWVIQNDIIERAQKEVRNAIQAAEVVYENEIENIRIALELVSADELYKIKDVVGLDYIYEVPAYQQDGILSPLARRAFQGEGIGGTRVISADEFRLIAPGLPEEEFTIAVRFTPKAKPTDKGKVQGALALEYAMPIHDIHGKVSAVRFGGRILNRDSALVDKIRDLVFGNELYENTPVGTVTIFQHDTRVATNVLTAQGERAIGTRVSEVVANEVLEKHTRWQDRAFVVTDWYYTAYEPIRNLAGEVIGILYVGILEKPFIDLQRNIFFVFMLITGLTGLLAVFFAYLLAHKITRPVYSAVMATQKIAEGDFSYRIQGPHAIKQFDQLRRAFNSMAATLTHREQSVREAKERAEVLNKRYLDLVGFVSHELKGILSSIILNVYSLQNELLGPVSDPQKKTLRSMSRNLDYLAATVKNFLNLSRIEKGEMAVNRREVLFREDIVDVAVESFAHQAQEKRMRVENEIQTDLKVRADPDLMQIVMNNLLNNAVKYGAAGGLIRLRSRSGEEEAEIEVFNEGYPIPEPDLPKLFKKFSRLSYEGVAKVKGTGIGLFITKEIVEHHGGTVWAEPKENGNSFYFRIKRV